MRKIFILFLLYVYAGDVTAMIGIVDPFAEPIIVSCPEWSAHLRKQLTAWHFKGIVHSSEQADMVYQKIWLLNDNQNWLEIITPSIPLELQPWLIQSMTSSSIIWQTKLPEYCSSSLLVRMELGE